MLPDGIYALYLVSFAAFKPKPLVLCSTDLCWVVNSLAAVHRRDHVRVNMVNLVRIMSMARATLLCP